MQNLLCRRAFGDLLKPSEAEQEHIDNCDDEDHIPNARQKKYTLRQDQAKGTIFDHLETRYYRYVRDCVTVRDIFYRLDNNFLAQTDYGLAQTRKAMASFEYDGKTPFSDFVDEYIHRVEAYLEAGGSLTDDEWVYQLQGALPAEFDGMMDWYESLPTRKRSFFNYRAKLLEKANRLTTARTIPSLSTSSGAAINDEKNGPSSSKSLYCTYCRRRNHTVKECKRLKNKEEQTGHDTHSFTAETKDNENKPAASQKTKEDWSKFRSLSVHKDEPKDQQSKRSLAMFAHVTAAPDGSDDTEETISIHVYPTVRSSQPPIDLESYDDCMLLDSGTQHHLTNDINNLENARDPPAKYYIHGIDDSSPLIASKIGSMTVRFENAFGIQHDTTLRNVLYVPKLAVNLLSVFRITESDEFGVNFRANTTKIYDVNSGEILFSTINKSHLTWIRFLRIGGHSSAFPSVLVRSPPDLQSRSEPTDQVMLWHRRLGHASAKYLRWSLDTADGIPNLKVPDNAFNECTTCIQAKSTRLPHNSERDKPVRRFEIICSDICDAKCTAITGHKMFLTFIDAYSGYTHLIPLKNKSEVAHEFAKFHKWITNKFPDSPIAVLRCDGAREFTMGDTKRYCDEHGIRIDAGCPFSPELNGIAERKNRTILEKIRVLLIDSSIALDHWPYAARTATYLLNRLPSKTNERNRTPYEMVYDVKPDLRYTRVFGCIAMRHIPEQTRHREATIQRFPNAAKLGPVARFAVLFGHTDTGYELFDLDTEKIIASRDVRFLELENIASVSSPDIGPGLPSENTNTSDSPAGTSNIDPESTVENVDAMNSSAAASMVDPQIDIDPPLSQSAIDPVTEIVAMVAAIEPKWKRVEDKLSDYIPKNYNDAIQCRFADKWISAINAEFDSHRENKTWHVVPRREARNIIRTLWVFTTKSDQDGNEIAKARLVAVGCADTTAYGATDTYAAVCPIETVRLVLSLAVIYSLEFVTLDVTTAFLYGQIHKDVFVSIPQGLAIDRSKYALKLDKALYGLKISPKLWHDTLREKLITIGYSVSVCERCLYFLRRDTSIAILITYVDDILLASNSRTLLDETLHELSKAFKMKVHQSPKTFIGLEIHHDPQRRSLRISQSRYIRHLSTQFNISEGRSFTTPIETNLKIHKSESTNDDREFRAYIGALLYVARFSRPDIAFAVQLLSTHQGCVTPEVKTYAKRVMRYLLGTHRLSIEYTPDTGTNMWRAYVDASHATETNSRSTSGFIFFHFTNLIDWSTRKQPIVALSSTAAEIIAIASNIDNMLVPRALVIELFMDRQPVDVFEDNSSAILALDGGQNRRLKWTMIKAHAVKEAVEHNYLRLHQVSSRDQLADGMTKALDRGGFERMRGCLLSE